VTTEPCLEATRNRIDVWVAQLETLADQYDAFLETLSADEQQRTERFYFDVHRRRFATGRGVLRSILSRYLGCAPAEVSFGYGEHGKPTLAASHNASGLTFNASGSHELAVYAVTMDRELGVDVEWMEPERSVEKIVERFFAKGERAAFRSVAAEERRRAFFQIWTRKEAYIKALGEGLSRPLNSFELSVGPGAPARVVSDARIADAAARWGIRDLEPGVGYSGALVATGNDWEVEQREWRA
jgi:4'-phosphopantetheinyl transferase